MSRARVLLAMLLTSRITSTASSSNTPSGTSCSPSEVGAEDVGKSLLVTITSFAAHERGAALLALLRNMRDICELGVRVDVYIYTTSEGVDQASDELHADQLLFCKAASSPLNVVWKPFPASMGVKLVSQHRTLWQELYHSYDFLLYLEDDMDFTAYHYLAYVDEWRTLNGSRHHSKTWFPMFPRFEYDLRRTPDPSMPYSNIIMAPEHPIPAVLLRHHSRWYLASDWHFGAHLFAPSNWLAPYIERSDWLAPDVPSHYPETFAGLWVRFEGHLLVWPLERAPCVLMHHTSNKYHSHPRFQTLGHLLKVLGFESRDGRITQTSEFDFKGCAEGEYEFITRNDTTGEVGLACHGVGKSQDRSRLIG